MQARSRLSRSFKVFDGFTKQANSLISLAKITTCTGLHKHELDLLGWVKTRLLPFTDEPKSCLRAS